MENKTQGPRNLEFVLSEDGNGRSRDEITIASGEGILVSELQPGSSAQSTGLREGDIIQAANRMPIK